MGLAPLALVALHVSCWRPAAPARVGPGSPPAVLLQAEERDDQEHRAHFEEWCRAESAGQAALRTELQKARAQAAAPEGSAVLLDTLSHQAAGLASLVERRRAEFSRLVERRSRASMALQHLEKQVEALSSTKGQLEAVSRQAAGAGGGTALVQEAARAGGSLKVVSELLQKAQSRREQVASEVAREPAELQREVDALEQQFQANTSGLAALRATRKATLRRQELLLDALESEDAFLADLDSICRLGQEVYGRIEAEFPKILHSVVQLIDQCEEELRTSTTPATTPPTTTAPLPATQAAASDATTVPATPAALAATAADSPPAAQAPAAASAAAAAPAVDPAVESLAQLPPAAPRPRRSSGPGAPPAAASAAALRAPRAPRAPTTAARAPPEAEDDGDAQDLGAASDPPAAPPAPRKKAARASPAAAAAAAEEAELDPANDPPVPPAPRKKAARASSAAAAEEAELDPANDPPVPPAPRKKATRASPAAAAEEAELDPANDPPVPPAPRKKATRAGAVAAAQEETDIDPGSDQPPQPDPRKKASPRQRGLAEARRVEEQFDEGDDSGDVEAPAAGPARGAEGPGGHLRADGDRLARLSAERGAKAPKGEAAAGADADSDEAQEEEEEAAPLAHRKQRAQAAAAPPADGLAEDGAPAAPGPRPSRKRRRAAEAAEKLVLDQQESGDEEDADAAQDSVAPSPPTRHRSRRPALEENAAAAAQDDDAADEEPPPPRRKRHHRPDAGQQAEAATAEEPPQPSADAAVADAEPAPKGMPSSLRGGWKAMLKGKKKPRKHDFHDQTSGIMDLVQTPTTYAAWHPEHSDTSLAASAKNELLAAEKAFDTSDGGDGGAAPESFLQLARGSAGTRERPLEAFDGPGGADFGRAAPEAFLPRLLARARLATFAGASDDAGDDDGEGATPESFLQLAGFDDADDGDGDGGAAPESFLQLPGGPEVVLPPQPALPPMPTSLIEEPAALLTVPALAPLLPSPAAPADAAAGATAEKADAVGAASLLLEQYAHSLGSGSLLQLARARPSLSGLKALWKRLSATDSTASAGHDAETSAWCRDFERQTEATARAAARARGQAKTGLAAANAERKALEQEAAIRKHLLDELRLGSKSLTGLLGSVKRRGASTAALFKAIQDQVQKLLAQNAGDDDADVSAKVAAAQEALGRAEGLSTSGDAEVQDIISAALARRAEVERAAQAGVAQLQAHMRSAERRRAELRRAAAPPATDAEGGTAALKEHYGQMCRWTLDEMQARRLHEESEKDAIRAALAVLGAR